MSRLARVVLGALLLAGCNTAFKFDPEGHRCDPGGACPEGYSCLADVCAKLGGPVGGGTGGGGTGKCAGVVCNSPPASTCVGTTRHGYVGRCDQSNGTCAYDPQDTTCAGGCANGACIDACTNVTCTMPPQPTCSGNQLTTFAQVGTCNPANGQCGYAPTTNTCAFACDPVNKRCVNQDLCAGVTCTTPPMPTCVNGAARTFAATGTCDVGTGMCTYAPSDMNCGPATCASGACVTPSLTFSQIGPRLKFAVRAIDVAPGSGGDNVLALGGAGEVSRWNGQNWTAVNSPSTASLNAVHFVNGGAAMIVGSNRTVWTFRNNAITAQSNVPGSGGANLVAVYGRDLTNVLIADDSGGWLKFNGTSWSNGNLPGNSQPYTMMSAYIDETGRERIGGVCNGIGSNGDTCIAYRNPSGMSMNWFIDTDNDSAGCSALGPWTDAAGGATQGPDVLCGKPDSNNSLARHSYLGNFSNANLNLSQGDGVVGIAGGNNLVPRDVWVLTSSSVASGGLYRITKSGPSVSATKLLDTFFGAEHLSLNDSGGVLVAEVRRTLAVNNIFRRSPAQLVALDLGEDFVTATADTAGTSLFLLTTSGDIAISRGQTTYDFVRGPYVVVAGAEARNGGSLLYVGKDGNTNNGVIMRGSNMPPSLSQVASTSSAQFNAVCRISDTEAYAVGTGGTIYSINSSAPSAARVTTTGTGRDLYSVDCAAGSVAVACGDNGAVVRLSSGAWSTVNPPFPVNQRITSCRLINGTIYAAGDGFFYKLGATGWVSLASRTTLRSLVVRSANEIYAVGAPTSTTAEVLRYDGATWSSLVQVPATLGGGVQIGGRVVYGGTTGAIVEGR